MVGPWGGNGGSAWDDGSYNGIREITIVHARCIDSIKVVYDKNGKPFMGEKHGGVGGSRTSEVSSFFLIKLHLLIFFGSNLTEIFNFGF